MDTSSLLFWLFEPGRLSARATKAINGASSLLVSSISIWEIAIKVKNGRLTLPLSARGVRDRLQLTDRIELLAVDDETWLANVELQWDHRDPADRTLVALASARGCSLVTPDEEIRAFYRQAVW